MWNTYIPVLRSFSLHKALQKCPLTVLHRDFKTQRRDGDKNVAEKVNLRYEAEAEAEFQGSKFKLRKRNKSFVVGCLRPP